MKFSKTLAGAGFAGLLLASVAGQAFAGDTVIAQELSGPQTSANGVYWGETFTTAAGAWDDITVSFYNSDFLPQAAGVGYLFTSAYAGTPNGLSSAGAFGVSVSSTGGMWSFAPSLTLAGLTTYFFYEDTPLTVIGNAASSEHFSYTFDPNGGFTPQFGNDIKYTVTGSSAGVPEPAAWAFMILGFGGVGLALRQRSRRPSLASAA